MKTTVDKNTAAPKPLAIIPLAPLAIGRGGVGVKKGEGDGITPLGDFKITEVLYRADKMPKPLTNLPCHAIDQHDIWVDDPLSPAYNQKLQTADYQFSHEKLWRADDVYNLIAVLDYNMNPIVRGKGSAIFIHLARKINDTDVAATEGCLALDKDDLYKLLRQAHRNSVVRIARDGFYLLP